MEPDGISDIEGKAAMGSGERAGKRASFKSVYKSMPQQKSVDFLGKLSANPFGGRNVLYACFTQATH
jgi:hypothetical protein